MFVSNGTAVDNVIVDGRVVVEGRKVLGVDEEPVRLDMDVLFHDLVASVPKVRVEREM